MYGELRGNGIDIGLVNNMPDSALEATERQFLALLDAAADGMTIRVTFYTMPDIPRSESGQRHVSAYRPISDLWNTHLDGLIVTGTEPRTPNLEAEPYWASLTGLMDWANSNTSSAIWSCLAAHAAVLYGDGILRRKLDSKRSGIFECEAVNGHELTAGVPTCLWMPHSRWNDLPGNALESAGYRILLRSKAGMDVFAKQRKSLFLFFQGHPEYDGDTLLREYRRDIRRYLRFESEAYPTLPQSYFDDATTADCTALKERAMCDRREEIIEDFPKVPEVANKWRSTAVHIYGNWLSYLARRKTPQFAHATETACA